MNLITLWSRFSKFPGGPALFSRMLGWKIPYSSTIGAQIEELRVGHARVALPDRRRVRNHLRSIHAVALMNLAELTSGLAAIAGLPKGMRGILVGFRIEYLKKSRGRITATADFKQPLASSAKDYELTVELKDAKGDTVCRAFSTWRIGPST